MSDAAGVSPIAKTISRFLPVTDRPAEECERYYTEVHYPWARQMLRARPQVLTYHTNRVLRQYDLLGGFRMRPTAWRFVILTFLPGRGLELDADTARTIAMDHPNCLRDLRGGPVEETVVLDRLGGQTALAKYLVELDRHEDTTPETAWEQATSLVEALADAAAEADGVRLLRLNRVLGEAETAPVVEPGQRTTGRMLPSTDKVAYVEVYVDDRIDGDRFFAQDRIRRLLSDRVFATQAVYHVEERCGLDRR